MRSLFSACRIDGQPQAIVRDLEPAERSALELRSKELRDGLCPYRPNERSIVESLVAGMFGGFRSMRQEGAAAEATVMVTASILREFPAWAIEKGCIRIAQNQAGLDPRYPPNDTQVYTVVAEVVREFRETLKSVDALLAASVERPLHLPQPKPAAAAYQGPPVGEEPNAPLRNLPDGKHAARIAADLAERKSRNLAALIKAGMA